MQNQIRLAYDQQTATEEILCGFFLRFFPLLVSIFETFTEKSTENYCALRSFSCEFCVKIEDRFVGSSVWCDSDSGRFARLFCSSIFFLLSLKPSAVNATKRTQIKYGFFKQNGWCDALCVIRFSMKNTLIELRLCLSAFIWIMNKFFFRGSLLFFAHQIH